VTSGRRESRRIIMSDIRFELEWVDVEGARGEELCVTWARFRLEVGGEVVTEAYDPRSRSLREHILVPLYPVAEWIAMNWWPLLYEPESPARATYSRRHNLRHAREGFAFPDFWIVPTGAWAHLAWSPLNLPAERLRFVGSGSHAAALESVRDALAELVTTVAERLEVRGVQGTPLQEEWRAIVDADPEEAAFCEAAARLGVDPYGLGEPLADQIVAIDRRLPAEWRDEFFAASSGDRLTVHLERLEQWCDALRRKKTTGLSGLVSLRERCQRVDPHLAPWRQGYEIAGWLRGELGLDGALLPDHAALADALGISADGIHEVADPLMARSFDALLDVVDGELPGFVTTKHRPEQARFAFARALFEYLTGGQRPTALLTQARTERQKRNRAFAAEFLAPAVRLRERLSGDDVLIEELEELAAEIGVSTMVVVHQVENHGLARIVPY